MKCNLKIQLVVFILSAFAFLQPVNAQLYIGLNSGYHFPVLRDYLGYQLISSPNASDEYQSVYSTFGTGELISLNAGYSLNPNIAFELEASFLYGKKFHFNISPYLIGFEDENIRSTVLRFSPAVKLSAGKKKMKPFILVGPSVGIWPRIKTKYYFPNDDSTYIITIYKGGIPIGVRTELGLNWKINNSWSANGYFSGIFQNWSPTKSIITEWKEAGSDALIYKTRLETETIYVDKPVYSGNTNKPNQSYKFTYPLSSAGIMLGLNYSF